MQLPPNRLHAESHIKYAQEKPVENDFACRYFSHIVVLDVLKLSLVFFHLKCHKLVLMEQEQWNKNEETLNSNWFREFLPDTKVFPIIKLEYCYTSKC